MECLLTGQPRASPCLEAPETGYQGPMVNPQAEQSLPHSKQQGSLLNEAQGLRNQPGAPLSFQGD